MDDKLCDVESSSVPLTSREDGVRLGAHGALAASARPGRLVQAAGDDAGGGVFARVMHHFLPELRLSCGAHQHVHLPFLPDERAALSGNSDYSSGRQHHT